MKKILICLLLVIASFIGASYETSFAASGSLPEVKFQISDKGNINGKPNVGGMFEKIKYGGEAKGGAKGFRNLFELIAYYIKYIFYFIALIYFFVITIKLIASGNTQEESSNFIKGVMWISVGLIVMQLAAAFVEILGTNFNAQGEKFATNLIDIIIPIINLLVMLAGFLFFAMIIYAFFSMITANGNDDQTKTGRMTVVYGIIGLLVIKVSQIIVDAFYYNYSCKTDINTSCKIAGVSGDITGFPKIVATVINWMNSFVAIIVIILIIYTGLQLMFSGGSEDRVSKAKKTLLYIVIGIVILVTNYLIITFLL